MATIINLWSIIILYATILVEFLLMFVNRKHNCPTSILTYILLCVELSKYNVLSQFEDVRLSVHVNILRDFEDNSIKFKNCIFIPPGGTLLIMVDIDLLFHLGHIQMSFFNWAWKLINMSKILSYWINSVQVSFNYMKIILQNLVEIYSQSTI